MWKKTVTLSRKLTMVYMKVKAKEYHQVMLEHKQ